MELDQSKSVASKQILKKWRGLCLMQKREVEKWGGRNSKNLEVEVEKYKIYEREREGVREKERVRNRDYAKI
jgi:hypothetical protein